MKTKAIIGVIVLVLVLFLGISYPKGGNTVVERVVEKLGAIPGDSAPGPMFNVGGFKSYYASTSLRPATTTVCSLKSPSATSTLRFGGISYASTTATTTATVWLAKSSSAYGTSSTAIIGIDAIANLGKRVLTATTSVASGASDEFTFAPNQYFLAIQRVGIGSASEPEKQQQTLAQNYWNPSGFCQAEWAVYEN